jgi:hypothetical protein
LSKLEEIMSERFATPFDQPDPDAVARSDRYIDALASGEPVDGDTALAGLLGDWRDALRAPGSGGVCPERDAVAVLGRGLAARRRARRRVALVGALAAAMLGVAGFGALMGQSQPGEALYGVRTTLFGEPASVHDDRIAVSAETDLDQVEQMIALGQWDEAQGKLAAVGDRVQTVKDSDRKQNLIEHMNRLNAQVVTRDPNAVLPPTVSTTVQLKPFGG